MCAQARSIFLPLFVALATAIVPLRAHAHRPVLVERDSIRITSPELSAAYYDILPGHPRRYIIECDTPWNLYLNILVPRDANGKGRYDADVIDMRTGAVVDSLRANTGTWRQFWEPYGADWYMQGPELRRAMPAGTFVVRVGGMNNTGAYALAVGEREAFGIREAIESIDIIPTLKRTIFRSSPLTFLLSPFGIGLFVGGTLLGVLCALVYRRILRTFQTSRARTHFTASRNIGGADRIARLVFGIACLLVAVFTTWNILLFLAAGFSFYQAASSWCAMYSLLGRNTCQR